MVTPRRKRFTMAEYWERQEEIRARYRQKPLTAPENILGRIRQAMRKPQKPRLPKI